MNVLAIDIGGTKIACGTYASDGKKLTHHVAAIGERSGKEVGALLITLIRKEISTLQKSGKILGSVGISVPGIYTPESGTVWAPNISGWESYPLLNEVAAAVKLKKEHIRIEGDRACYILGEAWQGCAQGCNNAIFMAVGTGIGAGILADGRVLHGQNDIAGAIGWLALDRHYRPEYKTCGYFEYYASGEGLLRFARELLQAKPGYKGALRTFQPSKITTPDLFAAYDQNDELAKLVLERAISLWGMTAANLVSLFNPEVIVFGGGVFGPAVRFISRIRDEMELWAQPISVQKVRLEPSKLGGEAGLAGAAFLAISSLTK